MGAGKPVEGNRYQTVTFLWKTGGKMGLMEVLVIEKSPMKMSAFRYEGDALRLEEWLERLNLEGVSVADYLDIPEGHWLVDESPFGGVEHYTPRDFEDLFVVVGAY